MKIVEKDPIEEGENTEAKPEVTPEEKPVEKNIVVTMNWDLVKTPEDQLNVIKATTMLVFEILTNAKVLLNTQGIPYALLSKYMTIVPQDEDLKS